MFLFIWNIKEHKYGKRLISIHLMFLFIPFGSFTVIFPTYFNTSHVLIYQFNRYSSLFCFKHFNTSHVLIYQSWEFKEKEIWIISIHLMFLFIRASSSFTHTLQQFQYISCSYLSRFKTQTVTRLRISIHLMFLFIELHRVTPL